jgi:hypothetical protein
MATPKKKATKKTAQTPSDLDISRAEKINIDQLFEHAVLRHKKDDLIDKKVKYKEISHLSSMAEEYLSSFALIGFSLQDEEVVVFNVPTRKDEAALADLLRSTFIDMASNRP